MASVIHRCIQKQWINPPNWIGPNLHYEGVTGSVAYGMTNDMSDMDIYAWAIPPVADVFPHLDGQIIGFGKQRNRFKTWQQHHIEDKEKKREYDITIYNIVDFFNLCLGNNPNMIDALFLPRRCILFSTQTAELVRDHRREFLHRGCWYSYRGYAFSQMNKIKSKTTSTNPKRAASIQEHGFDLKYASHLVRLLLQVEEILLSGDLHLDRNSEMLKSIRRGEWDLPRIEKWAAEKETSLELLFAQSKLPDEPDEEKLKRLLMKCLESHYGSLDKAIKLDKSIGDLVRDMEDVLKKYKTGE